MTTFATPKDRYQNDAQYRALVDQMVAFIERAEFTPSEMREASMLASIIYEQRHLRRYFDPPSEVTDALETLEKWSDR